MNTELLRDDERESDKGWWPMVVLLRQRLIEAREMIREGVEATCECDWCCRARDYLATISSVPR